MKTKKNLDRRCRLLLQCSDGSLTVLDRGDTESKEADYRRNLPKLEIPLGYAYRRYRDREMEDPRLGNNSRDPGALPVPDDTPFYHPQYVTTPSPVPSDVAIVDPVTIYSVPSLMYETATHLPTPGEVYHSQRTGLASGDIGGIVSGTVSPKLKEFPGGEERVRAVNHIRGAIANLIPFTAALDVTSDLIDAYEDGRIQDAYDLYEWAIDYVQLTPAEAIKFAGTAAAALLGSDAVGFTDYVVPYISPNYPVYDMLDSLVEASTPERDEFHGIRDTMVPIEQEMYNQFFGLDSDEEATPLVKSMSSITYDPTDDPLDIYLDVGNQVLENLNDYTLNDPVSPVQRFDEYTPSGTSGYSNKVYDADRGSSILTDVALAIPDVPDIVDVVNDVGSTVSDFVSDVQTVVSEATQTVQDNFDKYIWTPLTDSFGSLFGAWL